ncbi:interferon-related developmental regulator 1-like [Paramuricea clavata]|uniref:Interferon-related developmental regulator 1-like n=1 Tax=Paramuricea clavata TaxID=317549 RepID=A0A6S7JGW4_PARCT|nr:interferon-related developmental regulator 1-like [Paramuricea clavata]
MEAYTFDDLSMLQQDFFHRKTNSSHRPLQNILCHNAQESSYRFVNPEINYMNQVIHEYYSPDQYMYLADSSKTHCFMALEVDLVEALLHEIYHDSGLSQNVPTTLDDLPTIPDVDLATTKECYKSGYPVDQTGLDCFDDTFGDYCIMLCEEFGDKDCNRTMSKSVAPSGQVQKTLKNKEVPLLLTSPYKDEVAEILKDALEDGNFGVVPFTNDDKKNNTSCKASKGIYELPDLESQCNLSRHIRTEETFVKAEGNKPQGMKRSGLKRVREEEKDERYWKRRMKNNAAAKKCREARNNRYTLMKERIKELEIENAEKSEHIRTLKQKDGTVPEETVKFGHETMYLYTWAQRRQYAAFKDLLGPGINLHLKENQLLREIFELGPPVKVDAGANGKASRDRRKMYNIATSKARTISRGKHRDKRSFVH